LKSHLGSALCEERTEESEEPPSSIGVAAVAPPPANPAETLPPPLVSSPQTFTGFIQEKLSPAVAARRERVRAFRRKFFPQAKIADWNDWRWQLRSRVKDLPTLARMMSLSTEELEGLSRHTGDLPVGITPHYASLIDPDDPLQGIRRTMIPVGQEHIKTPEEADDPLGEDHDSPVPGLVHRYPDRVLFLISGFCAVYCRYCTRSRMVGQADSLKADTRKWEAAIDYIRDTPSVRDVLISGGDPLTLADEKLEWLLGNLRAIPHVEFIRIGSKVPCVLPQRITPKLCRMLRQFHPLWMSVHFLHPDELTPEVGQACAMLADAGIPLGSQTVLLKGVNDDVETMKKLVHGLLKIRVRPYYLYQCDPISGSAHFRTPVEKGLEIIEGLRGHTTGYAVPQYVIDAPGGGGKIPLLPQYVVGREGRTWTLRNFEGKMYQYVEPEN
jgi:lysine 2,3-aminomutase